MDDHQNDIYYDHRNPSHSPGSRGPSHPQMLHQPSRNFDAYGTMPNHGYTPDDQSLRYETNRFDRMNGHIHAVGPYGYDPQQAQTWNPNAFSSNNNFPTYAPAATGRMKSQTRGRTALPTVCPAFCLEFWDLLTELHAELDGPTANECLKSLC